MQSTGCVSVAARVQWWVARYRRSDAEYRSVSLVDRVPSRSIHYQLRPGAGKTRSAS